MASNVLITRDSRKRVLLTPMRGIPGVAGEDAVPTTRQVNSGTGLTGGGDLTADRTLALNAASQTSLGKADTAVQPAREVATQHSLTGGGDLSANRTLALVGDAASPGNNKVYGTDGSGTRGFKDDPVIPGTDSPPVTITENHTIVAANVGATLFVEHASDREVTLGDLSTEDWPIGDTLVIVRAGTGEVDLLASGAVSLKSTLGSGEDVRIPDEWGLIVVYRKAGNDYLVSGAVAEVPA